MTRGIFDERRDLVLPLGHATLPEHGAAQGRRVKVLPEVETNWRGFCIPHLNVIGVSMLSSAELLIDGSILQKARATRRQEDDNFILLPRDEWDAILREHGIGWDAFRLRQRDFDITKRHERQHALMSGTWMNIYRRFLFMDVIAAIDHLSRGIDLTLLDDVRPIAGRFIRPLQLPLQTNPNGCGLERFWTMLLAVQARAAPVEEVTAIWWSLLLSGTFYGMTEEERATLEWGYKAVYGRVIPGFSQTYDLWKHICATLENVSENAPVGCLVACACTALQLSIEPHAALDSMLLELSEDEEKRKELQRTVERGEPIDGLFSNIPGRYDLKKRGSWTDFIAASMARNSDFYEQRFLVIPEDPVVMVFEQDGSLGILQTPNDLPEQSWIELFLFESLRQQLATGCGLQCPLWKPGRTCCGGEIRALIEGIWAHTEGPENSWRRSGCLQG